MGWATFMSLFHGLPLPSGPVTKGAMSTSCSCCARRGAPFSPFTAPSPRTTRSPGLGEGSHDEKNIRRRVYDALNVLEAVGILGKDKKDIRWCGWPGGLGGDVRARAEGERAKALARLQEKLHALQVCVVGLGGWTPYVRVGAYLEDCGGVGGGGGGMPGGLWVGWGGG
jgi:hypothetical protein